MTISSPEDLLRHGVVEHLEPRQRSHNENGRRVGASATPNEGDTLGGPGTENRVPKEERFKALRLDAIEIPVGHEPLVEDILLPDTLAVVFGESGCGKSFFVSHMALHAAAGWSWAGKRTQSGATVYITAEGAQGFRKRMVAYREHYKPPADTPFFVMADSPDLGHRDGDAGHVVTRIKQQVGPTVSLVIIDTMARVMHGADENSAADVSDLIENANRISSDLKCAVLLVHHAGKDAGKGARGSSALRAGADTEIFVEKTDGAHRATVTKQKDLESGLTLAFAIEPYDFANGDTTCVVKVQTWQRGSGTKAPKVTGAALTALRALKEAIADHGSPPSPDSLLSRTIRVVPVEIWKGYFQRGLIDVGTTPDAKRKAFNRASNKLQEGGFISAFNDVVWLTDKAGHAGHDGTS